MHRHVGRRLEQRLGVVEDDLHAGRDEIVRRPLRATRPAPRARRRRRCARARARASRSYGSTETRPIGCPSFASSVSTTTAMLIPCSAKIEDEAIAWPSRPAPTSATLCWPCVRRILRIASSSELDRVADAALAELAEVREVAADLRRVDVRVLGDLLRRDPRLPHLPRLRQHLEVPGQARRDADVQALGHTTPLARLRNSVLCCSSRSSRLLVQPRGAARPGARGRRSAAGRRSRRPGSTRGTRPRARGRRRSRPRAARSRARRAPLCTTRRAASQRWQPAAV